jgi:small subunit ribosomal protein S16
MAVKIRLARHGRKGRPFYHVVVADSRSPRDGRIIERIGSYNPTVDPAIIDVDVDKAVDWIFKGAQPTNTAKRILSYKGVLLKKHLLVGVKKGALTEEQAIEKFNAWVNEKDAKVQAKVDGLVKNAEIEAAKKLDAEKAVNEKRAEALAAKKSELQAAAEAAAKEEAAAEAADEAGNEEPAAEEAKAE